jgi:branched-chain amino acid aminotransferase
VLWTDAKEHRYIDEAGMMNIMFMVDGKIITPALNTAILAGVTRDSVITLAKDQGIVVEERKIAVAELENYLREGRVTEVFGTGTAAVVAPVKLIRIGEVDYEIPTPDENSFQNKAYSILNDIRLGLVPDTHGWNFII